MAQTGYTPISIYYSSTATNVPTAGNLVAGELAINTADGKLFYKDSAGVVQVIGTKGGVGSSTTTQVLYNSSGLVVGSANMTFNGTTLTLANDASISGLTVGKGGGSVAANTALGASAIGSSNTGNYNSAVGIYALTANTSGAANAAFGAQTLTTNTTGANNTAFGTNALYSNTTASNNTAVGYQSLYSNTASENTAVGYLAGYSNVSGTGSTFIGLRAGQNSTAGDNTAIGFTALRNNTSGTHNVAVGGGVGGVSNGVLASNTTGSYNTAMGDQALTSNTTASYNTAVGYQAGYSSTNTYGFVAVGYQAGYTISNANNESYGTTFVGFNAGYSVSTGHDNNFFGAQAGRSTTTGTNNTAMGSAALYSNTTASYNTAIGYQAGYSNTTGQGNVYIGRGTGLNATGDNLTFVGQNSGYSSTGSGNCFVGQSAGFSMTSGAKNTILGSYSGNQGSLDIRTSSNYIVLSDGDGNPKAYLDASNNFVVNTTTGLLNCVGSYNTTSGAAANMFIGSNGNIFRSTSSLKYKTNVQNATFGLADVLKLRAVTYQSKNTKEDGDKVFAGLIAEEVDAAGLKEFVQYADDGTPDALSYGSMVALAFKAIQEQQALITDLTNRIKTLEAK